MDPQPHPSRLQPPRPRARRPARPQALVRANSCVLPPEPSNPRSSPPAIRNFSSSWTGRPSPKTLAREGDGTAQGLARRRAVALREMSAQINREKTPAKARALGRRALAAAKARRPRLRPATLKSAANVTPSPPPPTPARRVAEMEWSHDLTRQALQRLAKTHTEFADAKISRLNKPAAPSARPRPRPPHRAAGQSRPRPRTRLERTLRPRPITPDFAPLKFAKAFQTLSGNSNESVAMADRETERQSLGS